MLSPLKMSPNRTSVGETGKRFTDSKTKRHLKPGGWNRQKLLSRDASKTSEWHFLMDRQMKREIGYNRAKSKVDDFRHKNAAQRLAELLYVYWEPSQHGRSTMG